MSTVLIELDDRIITDKGEVVAKYDLLVRKALSGEVFTALPAAKHPDIERFNQMVGNEDAIDLWTDTGEDSLEGPDPEAYEWTIPKAYQELDVVDLAAGALAARGLDTDEYVERLTWELEQMDEREMFPFVRCLLYVVDQFHENGVVWGVGRGSSCESLVMFVLGINRVAPIK